MIRTLLHLQLRAVNRSVQRSICCHGYQQQIVHVVNDGLFNRRKRRSMSTGTAQQQQQQQQQQTDGSDHQQSRQWNDKHHHSKTKDHQKQRPSLESMTKHVELDFFGEPVTFLQDSPHPETTNIHKIRSNSMAAMDGFLLCVVSKGKTCTMGGGEGGLEIKSAHSAAIAWTEALTSSMVWNYVSSDDDENDRAEGIIPFESTMIAPMLAVVTVAPILAQTGAAYVQHLDVLLRKCKSRVPGLPPVQMMDMAYNAVQYKDDKEHFNERECMHLQALHHLLNQQYPSALVAYLKILRSCPGDALAVSLAMDLSHVLGDKQAALRYVSGLMDLRSLLC